MSESIDEQERIIGLGNALIDELSAEIERLSKSAENQRISDRQVQDQLYEDIEQLKAEIERLRAQWHGEIERSKLYAKGIDLVVEIRDAEIVRLRDILKRLSLFDLSGCEIKPEEIDGPCPEWFDREHWELLLEAREASKDE